MAGSIVQNALSARAAAMQEGDNFRTDRAKIMAGNALKNGDYTAGAGDLYSAGDIAGGQDVQTQGAKIKAATAIAGKDYGAAKQAYASAGDPGGVTAVDNLDMADKTKAFQFMQQAADALAGEMQTGGPQAVAAGFDKLAPLLSKIPGATPESLAQTRDALTGPNGPAVLKALQQHIKDELQVVNRGNGAYDVVNMRTGAPVRSVAGDPKYMEVDPTKNLVQVSPGAAPAGGSPAAAPAASGVPRNQRNNNPGNIEDGEFAKGLPGYAGTDGRFAKFDNPQNGAAAQGALLASYGKRGFDT